MRRGLKATKRTSRSTTSMIRVNFPDEEGTERSHSWYAAWLSRIRVNFPDEEGTESGQKPEIPRDVARLRVNFPDEEGTESSRSNLRTTLWALSRELPR